MRITVTFRHVDPTPALRTYAEEKLVRIKKYLRRPIDAHVILSVSKSRHVAEITLQADHVVMVAQEETHDLYSAIDLALAKLEHQAQKLKAKRRSHKGAASERSEPARRRGRRTRGDAADSEVPAGVIAGPRVSPRPMAVVEALELLRGSRDDFLVFTNAASRTFAVLYRRRDGKFGLIEPEQI